MGRIQEFAEARDVDRKALMSKQIKDGSLKIYQLSKMNRHKRYRIMKRLRVKGEL